MKMRLNIFRRSILLLFTGCLLISGSVSAQDGIAGTQSIFNFGFSARAMGVGRAYVALADDPSAVFWNPAGLEYVPRISFSLFHASLYEGALYDFIGFAYPTLQFGTVGIGYARLGVGDIPVATNTESYIIEGMSSYEFSEFYISYAKKLPYHIAGGITFKIERQSFDFLNLVTGGIGLDLGLMYRPDFDNQFLRDISIGFQYQNVLQPELKLGTHTENLPGLFRMGMLKSISIGLSGKMNFLMDYSKSQNEDGRFHAGTEYTYKDMGTARIGFDKDKPAFGAGVIYKFVQIDYSFGTLSDASEYFSPTHRFSLTFNLGKSREELTLLAAEKQKQREKELVERTKEEERQRFIAERLKKGDEYLRDGRYLDAYAEFQQVVSVDPFNKTAKALFDSTNNLIQSNLDARLQNQIAEAVDKEMAEENKKFVQLHFEKGQVFLQKNQFTDALIEFNMALERSGSDPIIQQAIQTTQRRLNEQVKKLVSQGRNEFQQGNYSEALRILSEALVLAPDDPGLQGEINTLANRIKVQQYVQQALQLYDLGEYQKALSLFEEALSLDPSNETIRQYVERSKRGLGVVKEEMDPESERQYIVGTELFLAGRYDEALEIWRQLAVKYPFNKKVKDAIKNAEDRIRRTKEN
jgi:tetratricopeptide (TPR) repeat protein